MIECNHTYIEVDIDGTIECTECGLRNSLSEGTEQDPTQSPQNTVAEVMGDTCRNGKPWDSCICC